MYVLVTYDVQTSKTIGKETSFDIEGELLI